MRPAIQQPVIHLYQTVFLLLAIVFVSGRQHCTEDAECHNKGKCNLTIGDCYACAPGWTGYMCEVEITACTSQPCVNGACTPDASKQNGYQCLCDTRFMGENCEEDKNECKYGVCPTESLCVNLVAKKPEDLGYSCICSEGLTGTKCETEVNLCKLYQDKNDNYCKNGGICEASKNCMCPDGFGGSRCDQRVPFYSEYDELGCKENAETCAKLFDNGQCDPICNSELCLFDGFDCAKTNVADVCRYPAECARKYGDGHCDIKCAGAECGFDGGDCDFENVTSLAKDSSMIGVAVGVPPDIAIKNLREMQAELAQRLYSYVTVAEDASGIMLYDWRADTGQGNRIKLSNDEDIVSDPSHLTSNGTMMFFDVDTAGCRQRKRRDSTLRCFTDLRVAAKFLTVELARENVNVAGILPIRDITWQKKELASWRHLAHSRLLLALFSTAIVVLFFVGCLTVLSIIIRTRKRKQKSVWAPIWTVPSEFDYHPPTPPYHGLDSPCSTPPREDHNENVVNSKKIRLCEDVYSVSVKEDSALLIAVRSGDVVAVLAMINSMEQVIDAVDSQGLGALHHAVANNDSSMLKELIRSGQFDIFDRNLLGQSPLVYAGRVGHPNLDCYRLLVQAIERARNEHFDFNYARTVAESDSDIDVCRKRCRPQPLSAEFESMWALVDNKGRNVIHYVAMNNLPQLVHYLVAYGADMNLIDYDGDAPIHLAARDGCVEAVIALLNCHAQIDVHDALERTALDLAVKNGHYVVANVLRGHGSGMKSSGDIPETSITQSLKRKKARVPEMAGATTVFAPIFPSRRDSEGYHSLETSTSRSDSWSHSCPGLVISLAAGPPTMFEQMAHRQKGNQSSPDIDSRSSRLDNDSDFLRNSSFRGQLPSPILTPPSQVLGMTAAPFQIPSSVATSLSRNNSLCPSPYAVMESFGRATASTEVVTTKLPTPIYGDRTSMCSNLTPIHLMETQLYSTFKPMA